MRHDIAVLMAIAMRLEVSGDNRGGLMLVDPPA
jgi:hypothetical protein